MRLLGSRQWQDGYPAPGHISADIGRNRGYVLCKPGVEGPLSVIAYGAVVFDGEPAYDAIDGQWLTDEPYVLVHRIAVADGERGRGVAAEFLHRVETLAQERGVKAFSLVIGANDHFVGNGHGSQIIQDDAGQDWLLYHGFSRSTPENGRILLLDQIKWDQEGWPYVEGGSPSYETQKAPVFNN